jgi:myosin-7
MQDRESSKDPYGHALKLTARGLCGSPEMRDEIFCQIIKQCNKNPNVISQERGWQLLSLCCGLFPPSEKFTNYLYCYLLNAQQTGTSFIKEHSHLALSNLDDTMINGARLQTPTLVEVKSYESLRPVVLNVETLDPSLHWPITCTAQMRVIDVFKQIGNLVCEGTNGDIDIWLNNFGIFQAMLVNDRLNACCILSESSRVLDVISFWSITRSEFHKKNSSAKLAFKFVFMVQFYLRHQLLMSNMPNMINILYYVQSVTDLRRGIYLCTEKEAHYLAALQLQVRLGQSSTPSDYNMIELLPVPLVAANPKLQTNTQQKRQLHDEIDKLRLQFNGW